MKTNATDIADFTSTLLARIKILHAMPERDSMIARGKALAEMRAIIEEFKHYMHNHSFRNVGEEITFFKETKPVILSHYYFQEEMFSIALFDSFRDPSSRRKNYNAVLIKMEEYARKHKELYEYFISGSTILDGHYFTREGRHSVDINADDKFTTGADAIVARFVAHQMVQQVVAASIERLDRESQPPSLPWKESKVALVELIYALHASGAVGNGKEDVKSIVNAFERWFSLDLGNYARTFNELQLRKSGQTIFIDRLKKDLERRINDGQTS